MFALISIGILSGLFFSSTFVLNRVMSLGGGSWVWSASLRYFFVLLFLLVFIAVFQGIKTPWKVFKLYLKNWKFWTIAGTIGFGFFYALLCYSADHAPAWVLASTWQLTIIASLLVLMGFGRKFPKKIWLFSLLIFVGVCIVNVSGAGSVSVGELLAGGLPVLVASFCYPIGNQLIWEAKNGNSRLPDINHPLMENPFNKILLMTLGTLPFLLLLIIVNTPEMPTGGQFTNTALIAFFSGILATGLFLYARNKAKKPSELAAVDATQASEVVFAMLGEVAIISAPLPNGAAIAGIVLIFIGLMFFIHFQEVDAEMVLAD